MKKFFLAAVLLLHIVAFAQDSASKKHLLTSVTDEGGITVMSLIDAYLSPLTYTGPGIYYQRASQKLFTAENQRLSYEMKVRVAGGFTSNPAVTANISYAGGTVSWGPYYHFSITNDLLFRAGGFLSAVAANNNNTRNVNNPINFDFNTNLNAAAEVKYKLRLFRKNLTVYGSFDFPLAGIMFVPPSGISYYQLVTLGDFSNTVHLSSLHNRQGLNVYTAVEVPFKQMTWKFGLGSENLTWTANDMVFRHDEFKLSVAVKYNIRRFSGTKNIVPENFISVE